MLTIDYEGLDELSCKDALLGRSDNSLASYPPSVRKTLIHYVFDEMRKRFCIDSLYLQGDSIEKTKRDAYEQLVEPWTILDDEKTQTARTLVFSKSSSKNRKKQEVDFFFVGPRSSIVRNERVVDDSADEILTPQAPWPTDHKAVLTRFSITGP